MLITAYGVPELDPELEAEFGAPWRLASLAWVVPVVHLRTTDKK